jgi:hypothetical protein
MFGFPKHLCSLVPLALVGINHATPPPPSPLTSSYLQVHTYFSIPCHSPLPHPHLRYYSPPPFCLVLPSSWHVRTRAPYFLHMPRTFAPIPHLNTFHLQALKLCLRTSVYVLPLAATQGLSHSSLTTRSMEIMSPLYNGLCRPSSNIQLQPLSFVIQFRPCTSELSDPTFLFLPLPCTYLNHLINMR